MNRLDLEHNENDPWRWTKAQQTDVIEMINISESLYQHEIEEVLQPNRTKLTYHLQRAILEQTYMPQQELLSVARDCITNQLIAWGWVERGKYAPYSNDEMAVAEFAHIDLSLSTKQRLRLTGQLFDQWIAWAQLHSIPVLCSTSIRGNQAGFMRLHDLYGFTRKGSFAYKRIV
jgi:hypothetical protein